MGWDIGRANRNLIGLKGFLRGVVIGRFGDYFGGLSKEGPGKLNLTRIGH